MFEITRKEKELKLRLAAVAYAVAVLALGLASAPSVQAKGGVPNQPKPGQMFAALRGPAIGGLVPRGNARFRNLNGVQDFVVEASPVNLPDGTMLPVLLNGTRITTMTVLLGVARSPLLATDLGDTVPAIQVGDVVTVTNLAGTAIIMSGHF
jgi:hypothetical protein